MARRIGQIRRTSQSQRISAPTALSLVRRAWPIGATLAASSLRIDDALRTRAWNEQRNLCSRRRERASRLGRLPSNSLNPIAGERVLETNVHCRETIAGGILAYARSQRLRRLAKCE